MANQKIKVSVVIKYIDDKYENLSEDKQDRDEGLVLDQMALLLNSLSIENDDEDKEKIVRLLGRFKFANEILADALIDADREDLFDEKLCTIESVDDIIKQIKNL
jgi:hypothetical protein